MRYSILKSVNSAKKRCSISDWAIPINTAMICINIWRSRATKMNCLRTVVWLPLMNAGVVMTNSGTERCFRSWMQITGSSDLGVVSWAMENRNILIRRRPWFLTRAGICTDWILPGHPGDRIFYCVRDIWMWLPCIRLDLTMQWHLLERPLHPVMPICWSVIQRKYTWPLTVMVPG